VPSCLIARPLTAKKNKFFLTTLGKLIFNQILPSSFTYYLNNIENYQELSIKNLEEISEVNEK